MGYEKILGILKIKYYKMFLKGLKGKKGKIMVKLIYYGIDVEV